MGCLLALLIVLSPRLAFFLMWIFTPLVTRTFNGFLIPLLGIIFLPFTSIIYVLVYSPTYGLTGWDWVWIFLAFLIDISAHGGSAYANKDKISGGSKKEEPKKEEKEEKEDEEKKEKDE